MNRYLTFLCLSTLMVARLYPVHFETVQGTVKILTRWGKKSCQFTKAERIEGYQWHPCAKFVAMQVMKRKLRRETCEFSFNSSRFEI